MAAHNPEVEGSNPSPATNHHQGVRHIRRAPFWFSGDQMLTSCSRRPTAGRGVQRARAVTSGCEEPQSSRQYSHDLVMLQKAGRNPSLSTRCGQPSGLYADQVVAP